MSQVSETKLTLPPIREFIGASRRDITAAVVNRSDYSTSTSRSPLFGAAQSRNYRDHQEDTHSWDTLHPTVPAVLDEKEIGTILQNVATLIDSHITDAKLGGSTFNAVACLPQSNSEIRTITANLADSRAFAICFDENDRIIPQQDPYDYQTKYIIRLNRNLHLVGSDNAPAKFRPQFAASDTRYTTNINPNVWWDGQGYRLRTDDGLMMYQTIGDDNSRRIKICQPDVYSDQFRGKTVIIQCSDGLTDVLSENEIATIVESCLRVGDTPQQIATTLRDAATERGAQDNVTVTAIVFDPSSQYFNTNTLTIVADGHGGSRLTAELIDKLAIFVAKIEMYRQILAKLYRNRTHTTEYINQITAVIAELLVTIRDIPDSEIQNVIRSVLYTNIYSLLEQQVVSLAANDELSNNVHNLNVLVNTISVYAPNGIRPFLELLRRIYANYSQSEQKQEQKQEQPIADIFYQLYNLHLQQNDVTEQLAILEKTFPSAHLSAQQISEKIHALSEHLRSANAEQTPALLDVLVNTVASDNQNLTAQHLSDAIAIIVSMYRNNSRIREQLGKAIQSLAEIQQRRNPQPLGTLGYVFTFYDNAYPNNSNSEEFNKIMFGIFDQMVTTAHAQTVAAANKIYAQYNDAFTKALAAILTQFWNSYKNRPGNHFRTLLQHQHHMLKNSHCGRMALINFLNEINVTPEYQQLIKFIGLTTEIEDLTVESQKPSKIEDLTAESQKPAAMRDANFAQRVSTAYQQLFTAYKTDPSFATPLIDCIRIINQHRDDMFPEIYAELLAAQTKSKSKCIGAALGSIATAVFSMLAIIVLLAAFAAGEVFTSGALSFLAPLVHSAVAILCSIFAAAVGIGATTWLTKKAYDNYKTADQAILRALLDSQRVEIFSNGERTIGTVPIAEAKMYDSMLAPLLSSADAKRTSEEKDDAASLSDDQHDFNGHVVPRPAISVGRH